MNEVGAIVEGPTELAFVRDVLTPHLALKGISLWACLRGSGRRQGGVGPWTSIRGDILRILKGRQDRYCTTMFDYYGMPTDWPGRDEASRLPWNRRGEHVENALAKRIAQEMGEGFRSERFVPYVQIHEFEAVLFSDVEALSGVITELPGARCRNLPSELMEIVQIAGGPEAIDDNPNTAPSQRILLLAPGYRKPTHGVIAAKRIGVSTMRMACPNFNRWLTRLESLGSSGV